MDSRKRFRVPLWGKPQGYVAVDPEATKGATLGVDLYRADGSIVSEADLAGAAPAGGSSKVAPTLWQLIQQIPANIKALAALATSGWIRRDGAAITARELAATDSSYDNTTSGLGAVDVQGAIDEVAGLTTSGAWVIVKKTADEVRNSTTTLADDSQLKMNLAANKLYQIRARCFYSIANATMDFKYQWAYSGTVGSAYARRQVYVAGMASGTDNEFIIVNNTFPGVSSPDSSAAGAGYFEVTMSLATTGAGVFSLQWAQNTSNAGNCIVLAGSCIEYLAF